MRACIAMDGRIFDSNFHPLTATFGPTERPSTILIAIPYLLLQRSSVVDMDQVTFLHTVSTVVVVAVACLSSSSSLLLASSQLLLLLV
jgi:hypothetical protein